MLSLNATFPLIRRFRQSLFFAVTVAVVVAISKIGHAAEPSRSEQLAGIERAITRGAGFLLKQQHTDGTWRSKTYGLLKDGTSLTPLVLWSMPKSQVTTAARDAGLALIPNWLQNGNGTSQFQAFPLYPVYCAGLAMTVLSDSGTGDHIEDIAAWRNLLLAYQLTDKNGWSANDLRFGGWGYSHEPPAKPVEGATLSPLDEPNLSATVFALEGLTAVHPDDRTMIACRNNALRFVQGCQNWRESAAAADEKFNDGGFHFILNDEVRNKAGVAGVDSAGETRFTSYGSPTADGLRCLLLCGLKSNHPRVASATNWLLRNFQDGAHPGSYPADRAHLRPSLDFYYLASLTRALRQLRADGPSVSSVRWESSVSNRLLTLQREDGSWSNPAVDVREDDPLIATSFALRALQDCLAELH